MIWVTNSYGTPVTITTSTTWTTSTPLPMGPFPAPDYRDGIHVDGVGAELTIVGLTLTLNNNRNLIALHGGVLNLHSSTTIIIASGGGVSADDGSIEFDDSHINANLATLFVGNSGPSSIIFTNNSTATITGTGTDFIVEGGLLRISNSDVSIGYLTKDFIVRQGGQFSIESNSTLTMVSAIKVSEGSLLDVSSSTLTGGTGTWEGIWVTGISTGLGLSKTVYEQYLIFPDPNVLNDFSAWDGVLNVSQTKVILDDADIINANIGVYSLDGGIIRTTGGEFLNCDVGIGITPYRSPSKPNVNACKMMSTTFKWNGNPSGSTSGGIGIYMEEVSGVNIGGCTFTNLNTSNYCDRGIGIKSLSTVTGGNGGTDFGIAHSGNVWCKNTSELNCFDNCYAGTPNPTTGFRNVFNQLSKGIWHAPGLINTTYYAKTIIKFCDFTNNIEDIKIEGGNYTLIQDNTFTSDRTTLNGIFGGITIPCYTSTTLLANIYTRYTYPVLVINNDFSYTGTKMRHVSVNYPLSGGKAKIRNNIFTNSNSSTIASDEVDGLHFTGIGTTKTIEIHCNEFNNLGKDIYVESGDLPDLWFSSENKAVKNKFSDVLTSRLRIDGGLFKYYRGSSLPSLYNPENYSSGGIRYGERDERNCDITCTELKDDALASVFSLSKGNNSFTMFPNPAGRSATLSIANGYFKSIRVIELDGKLIKEMTTDKQKLTDYEIDLSELSAGVYTIIAIDNKSNTIAQKLIKY